MSRLQCEYKRYLDRCLDEGISPMSFPHWLEGTPDDTFDWEEEHYRHLEAIGEVGTYLLNKYGEKE